MTKADKLNISFDPELRAQIEQAAATEGAKRGKPMPVAEWVRTACRIRLSAPATTGGGACDGLPTEAPEVTTPDDAPPTPANTNPAEAK